MNRMFAKLFEIIPNIEMQINTTSDMYVSTKAQCLVFLYPVYITNETAPSYMHLIELKKASSILMTLNNVKIARNTDMIV